MLCDLVWFFCKMDKEYNKNSRLLASAEWEKQYETTVILFISITLIVVF